MIKINFAFPFVLSLSKHERLSSFDKLRTNEGFVFSKAR